MDDVAETAVMPIQKPKLSFAASFAATVGHAEEWRLRDQPAPGALDAPIRRAYFRTGTGVRMKQGLNEGAVQRSADRQTSQ